MGQYLKTLCNITEQLGERIGWFGLIWLVFNVTSTQADKQTHTYMNSSTDTNDLFFYLCGWNCFTNTKQDPKLKTNDIGKSIQLVLLSILLLLLGSWWRNIC